MGVVHKGKDVVGAANNHWRYRKIKSLDEMPKYTEIAKQYGWVYIRTYHYENSKDDRGAYEMEFGRSSSLKAKYPKEPVWYTS